MGESTLKGKRGQKHQVAQNTRLSQHHPYIFGFRSVLLMVQWGVYTDRSALSKKPTGMVPGPSRGHSQGS
jgi:hypothetical protein